MMDDKKGRLLEQPSFFVLKCLVIYAEMESSS